MARELGRISLAEALELTIQDLDEPGELAFYCPACAAREFGRASASS